MKKTMKTILVLFLVLGFFTVHLSASTLNNLKDKKQDIKEDIKENQQELKDKEKSLGNLNANLDKINADLEETGMIISGYDRQLEEKQKAIDETQLKLDKAIEDHKKYKDQAIERIKVMYEYGDDGYIDVLIESKNLADFFTRLEYMNQIVKYDDQMFERLANIQNEIETAKATLVTEKAKIEHLKAEADIHRNTLEELEAKQNALIKTVENDKELLKQKLNELQQAEAELDRQIMQQMNTSGLKYSGGEMNWPVPGNYRISSYFGSRIHPIYGYTENHNGLDIPAPYGTSIQAASDGVVISSRWSNSYGNVIVVDHGSGYATLYAHCSSRLVNAGDTVTKGQVIAKIGSTGWSTGNHLHFGVQVSGKWVNPLDYFE